MVILSPDVVAGTETLPDISPSAPSTPMDEGAKTVRPTIAEACSAWVERNWLAISSTLPDRLCISSRELNCASWEMNSPLS